MKTMGCVASQWAIVLFSSILSLGNALYYHTHVDIIFRNESHLNLVSETQKSVFDWSSNGKAIVILAPKTNGIIKDSVILELVITAYLPVDDDGQCPLLYYLDCGNGRCIREVLRCDDYNNCGNNRDESLCGELPFLALLALDAMLVLLLGLGIFHFYRNIYQPVSHIHRTECTCGEDKPEQEPDKVRLLIPEPQNPPRKTLKVGFPFSAMVRTNWHNIPLR